MAHILQGIECPPSGEAFSDRTETMVGRIVGRRSSDPVKKPIDTHLGSSSGYHGRAATTAPNTAGAVLPGSSAGQVGIRLHPRIHLPPSMFAAGKFFCDVSRRGYPMFCAMLEFWRLLLLVLDPIAATFDVAKCLHLRNIFVCRLQHVIYPVAT
jgi:hypothetical protein